MQVVRICPGRQLSGYISGERVSNTQVIYPEEGDKVEKSTLIPYGLMLVKHKYK
jgi:hypothetical protein